MWQTHQRTARIVKVAGALAVFVVAGWATHHFARSESRELSRLAVAHYQLPVRYALAKYAWLSPHEVIIGTVNNSESSVLWQLDLLSERRFELTGVNQLWKQFNGTDGLRADWSLGPDRTLVICGRRMIMATDLSGRTFSQTGMITGLRLVSSPMWLAGPKAWLVVGLSNTATMGLIWDGQRDVQRVLLHTNKASPVGVVESEVVLLEIQRATSVTAMRFVHARPSGELSTRSRDIRLPFKSQVLRATLSPSGSRILWELGRTAGFPKPGLSATFPFVRFTKSRWQYSVWVSKSDGTGFVGLGLVPQPLGCLLEWHPDEGKISMVADGELVILEIPKLGK